MEKRPAHDFTAVVIGGSAGAVDALRRIVAGFPTDFSAAVFVTTHVSPTSVSAMPHLLARSGTLFATHAIDGAPIAPGRIVVAQPDHHLIIEDGVMRSSQGPMENNHRPSIDVLFRSAAISFGSASCGVLLSGTLDDGVAGLAAIREAGGVTLVQDPDEADFPELPLNAIHASVADRVLPAGDMVEAIESWLKRPHLHNGAARVASDERTRGVPSVFTCPDCGGTLWEADETSVLRFRCRTGHAYSGHSMLAAHESKLESAFWAAIRALEERRDLLARLTHRARAHGDIATLRRFQGQAEEVERDLLQLMTTLEGFLSAAATP